MGKPVGPQRSQEGLEFSGRAVLSGIVAALVTVLIATVVLSAAVGAKLAGSPWESLTLTVVQVVAYGLAGLFAGLRARGFGWLHGGLAAVGWVALVLIFQLIAYAGGPTFGAVLYHTLLAAAVGAISGVIGVNL